jgi:hypothetical protein
VTRNWPLLHRQVCFGESGGRIIWQPRIQCWLTDKRFAGEALPEPYEGLSEADIFRSLDCSARIYQFNGAFRAEEHSAVYTTRRALNATDTEVTTHTPVGKQVEVLRSTPNSPRQIHVKWSITTPEEMRVATWRADHTAWHWDQQAYDAVFAEWGDLGAPTMYMPRINIQDLFINTMGVQNAIYALYDWPDEVAAYFRALDDSHARMIEVINASPVDIINFGDNIHCGTLPPRLFRQYVMPAYHRRIDALHAAGKFVYAHWDGDTRTLLPLAHETRLDGIEAITPQPQGDVTLEEILAGLGDDMVLVDGLPAILFDEIYPVSMLEDYTHRLIEMFSPRLVLGISDEISSTGDIERVRVVGQIVDAHNARFE